MYHDNLDVLWSFETANFGVRLQVRPCEDDPADSFSFEEDVEAVRSGAVEWFDAVVTVYLREEPENREIELGWDTLCCCAYKTVEQFYTSHRDPDPLNRNSTIYRAKNGQNHVICHYFPSMVREAIADARAAQSRHVSALLRTKV